MGRHALRGAVTAWMALIVLNAVGTAGGSGRLASAFADVDRLIKRALSPDVPAIPDRRGGRNDTSSYITPAQAAAAVKAANGAAAVGAVTSPGGALDGLGSLGQYANGGGLSGLGSIDWSKVPLPQN